MTLSHRPIRFLAAALLLPSLAACAPSAAEPFDVVEANISELQQAMASGATSSVLITTAYLARIEAYDKAGAELNAMIRINPNALAQAEALDRERATRGPRGPLHGIPIILKDNYDLAGMPSTAGSLGLAGLIPPDDGFQVKRLREAGAVFLGKSNLHELATGISTIASLGGQTLNPYDLTRNPGGSSGGTGAAIASSFAAVGWGSDTCGSIRIPSSHNNLVGLRPTKGLSSIDGIIPLSHTQDTAGPLARSVYDLAIALDATIGPDPADPATRILEGRLLPVFTDALDESALQGARIGILTSAFGDRRSEAAAAGVVRAAIEEMVELGADTFTVEIPNLDSLVAGSNTTDFEFKWDLSDYLAGVPDAPVMSLRDLVDRGLIHESLTSLMNRRAGVETLDEEAYRAALAKRGRSGGRHRRLDERRATGCPRLPDDPLDPLRCPRSAERLELPVCGAQWPASDQRSSRVYRRWVADRGRAVGAPVRRRTPHQFGLRLRTGNRASAASAQHAPARKRYGTTAALLQHRSDRRGCG